MNEEYREYFLNYIYYNFLHELNARVNQTYEGYLYSKLDTLEQILDEFKNHKLYNILIFLGNFNHDNIINKYDENILLNLTNQFNVLYGDNLNKWFELKKKLKENGIQSGT